MHVSCLFLILSDKHCIFLLVQVYNLFRQLGLRHIFVVPRPSRVIGLITRRDLLIEVLLLSLTFLYIQIV